MDTVAQTMVVIAGLLLVGAFGEFIFARTRVPDVVWLVAAGILAGPVFELISPQVLTPAIPFFGAIALTVILAGGAFRLRLSEVAAAAPRGILLGFVGFIFSLIAIYAFFWLTTELGLVRPAPPLVWLMIAAMVGGSSGPALDQGHESWDERVLVSRDCSTPRSRGRRACNPATAPRHSRDGEPCSGYIRTDRIQHHFLRNWIRHRRPIA